MGLAFLVLLVIGFVNAKRQRRTSDWVISQNGRVGSESTFQQSEAYFNWLQSHPKIGACTKFIPGLRNHEEMRDFFNSSRKDSEMTSLDLLDSPLKTHGLRELKRLTNLKWAMLNDRQLGLGLELFAALPNFQHFSVDPLTSRISELRRVPQLKSLHLWSAESDGIDLAVLEELPQLQTLCLCDCQSTASLLKTLPQLPSVGQFDLQYCTEFEAGDLVHLQKIPHVKVFRLSSRRLKLTDSIFEVLSQLDQLETLSLEADWSVVTEAGMAHLKSLTNLKSIGAHGSRTKEQIDQLLKAVPNCQVK